MRLLLAVDLYDQPEELVKEALTWASRLSAKIDLIYTAENPFHESLVRDPAVLTILGREWEQIQKEQRAGLQALRASLPAEIQGEVLLRTGRAADEIAEAARAHDLVLVGTHGRRGLPHTLLGSVAERVIRITPTPVLVLTVRRAQAVPEVTVA